MSTTNQKIYQSVSHEKKKKRTKAMTAPRSGEKVYCRIRVSTATGRGICRVQNGHDPEPGHVRRREREEPEIKRPGG